MSAVIFRIVSKLVSYVSVLVLGLENKLNDRFSFRYLHLKRSYLFLHTLTRFLYVTLFIIFDFDSRNRFIFLGRLKARLLYIRRLLHISPRVRESQKLASRCTHMSRG